jgi:hypothetical protein
MVDTKKFDEYCLKNNVAVTDENRPRLLQLFTVGRVDLMRSVANGFLNRKKRRQGS